MPVESILIHEGKNEGYVVRALATRHRYSVACEFVDATGFDPLCKQLSDGYLKLGTDLRRIGIIIDAEIDLRSRRQPIRNILVRVGYENVPHEPDVDGTIIAENQDWPRVGIWIMPDNRLPGMLEDYVASLVPEGDPLWVQARRCLGEATVIDGSLSSRQTKALVHTWLGWQKEPGTPFGTAIINHSLDSTGPHVDRFLVWLRRVFD